MSAKPYPKDTRFMVYKNGSVCGPRGHLTFGSLGTNGRLVVTTGLNNKKVSYQVHRMVIETYKGDPPLGKVCSHLNGKPTDNRIENLAWETQKENCARKYEHGTQQSGERNPAAKLSKQDVEIIRNSTLSSRKIAPIFDVSAAHIRNIRRGDSWR